MFIQKTNSDCCYTYFIYFIGLTLLYNTTNRPITHTCINGDIDLVIIAI